MIFNLQIEIGDGESYLETSARLRGISRKVLLERTLGVIIKDQMFLSVLDDEGQPPAEQPGTSVGRHMPPQKPRNHPTQPSLYRSPRKSQPTKSELRDQLTQAVVNTGGTRLSLQDRKDALLARAKVRPFCPSDLGDSQELNKWWKALGELVAEGLLMKRPPAQHTRRVYYELRPTAVADDHIPTHPVISEVPPQDQPSAGDLVPTSEGLRLVSKMENEILHEMSKDLS